MTIHRRLAAALLCAAAASACGKDAVREITGPVPGAQVKFFNFGVGSPGVNFYANDQKMTAIGSATSTESTTGTTYGNAGAGGLYTAIKPGQYTLSGRIAAATDKDLVVSSITTTLADGKYYSYYESGFYSSATKTIDAFILEDVLPTTIDYTKADIRFVNAISNGTAPLVLSLTNSDTTLHAPAITIGGSVAYKNGGAFTPVPEAAYDLRARYAGDTTTKILREGVSFGGGHAYTITARGDITITSTTATNRPQLDNTANR